MQKSALFRFQTEFRKWVSAYNAVKKENLDPDLLLQLLITRIPEDRQMHIGAALLNGWLETENRPDRGYFVRETDRPGIGGGQPTITHYGNGNVAPYWELFVQLADYGWLRSIAERNHQLVILEDRLMDLTVSNGDRLILYVEHKEKASLAKKLIERVQYYGQIGFQLDDPDRGNDPLRKAKYMVRDDARPLYFGISAIGYRKLFKMEYGDGNRFNLIEDHRGFSAPLGEHSGSTEPYLMRRSPVAPLASEIEQLCPEIWISLGTGSTAYNFYLPASNGDAILIGVYQNGEAWTDALGIGPEIAKELAAELSKSGIEIDSEKQWCWWKQNGSNLKLDDVEPEQIAVAVRRTLDNLH